MPRIDELIRELCWAFCVATGTGALLELCVWIASLVSQIPS
jgi:hypothetical protein